jgi:hypothetical protein
MRCSYYSHKSVERFERSRFGFGGVDPRVLFIPSCTGYISLTGALDWSDRCEPFVGFASGKLFDSCVFGSWWFWSVLDLFGVVWVMVVLGQFLCRVFVPCRLCFGSVFVPGPREVTEALWNTCCAAAVATGLTDAVHRSDRCHRSDWRRPSV